MDARKRLNIEQLHGLMPCSFVGKIVAIEYFLKAYVKHDAWNEFGEGKFVVLPIKLTHPYVELKFQEPYT